MGAANVPATVDVIFGVGDASVQSTSMISGTSSVMAIERSDVRMMVAIGEIEDVTTDGGKNATAVADGWQGAGGCTRKKKTRENCGFMAQTPQDLNPANL